VETKKTGTDLEETNTTVMLTNINGGLAPAFKTHELRKRAANDTAETEKTTWLPDVNGKWQLSEIRQNVTAQEANGRRIEETVFQPDAEGKLSQTSRVVSQESESTSGEKRSVTETYSTDVPGTTRDGSLHLVERKTSTESSSSTGERATEQKIEQTNPGDPGAGLRVSVLVDGRMVPGPSGEQSTVTIRARDSNGNFGVVSVDTTKADRIPTFQVQQTPAEKP
jgi:flagellar biosynthesis/type III secretory pathway M-ring protein FliF/YscJ